MTWTRSSPRLFPDPTSRRQKSLRRSLQGRLEYGAHPPAPADGATRREYAASALAAGGAGLLPEGAVYEGGFVDGFRSLSLSPLSLSIPGSIECSCRSSSGGDGGIYTRACMYTRTILCERRERESAELLYESSFDDD